MDTTDASKSNGSTDAPDVVMGDNASHQENDQEVDPLTKKRKATDGDASASASASADTNAVSDATVELPVQSKKAKLDPVPNVPADRSLLPAEEMDLLMSTAPTFLIPALPFVFVTSLSSVVPLHAIQRGQLPPSCTLTKIFWTSDVDTLREEFDSVKELGAPAVEEWQKGLSKRGSDQKADSSKWEKYDESGGVTNMRTLLHPEIKPQAAAVLEPPKISVPPKAAETPKTAIPADKPTVEPKEPASSEKSDLGAVVKPPPPPPPPPAKPKTAEEIDADWDFIQGPVRLKILRYAEEAIAGDWDDGDKVTKDNAPAFAADVLLHVRKRFYMEVDKEAQAARAAGRQPVVDPAEGPFTQKLTLENMKYVFDVKIKPITSKVRTELFACPLCDVSAKFFGFEGTIQHYAAKHTNVLSVGNIVVFWRAEWPEQPPFRPNPRVHKGTGTPVPLHPPSAVSVPNQRGPGPAAKRSGKDYQSFGPPPPGHFPAHQQPATYFPPPPPPPVQAPVSLPPPPPPLPLQQQPYQLVRPQILPFSTSNNGRDEPQYNGPSFAHGAQQAHTFGAPSYNHTGQPQTGPAVFQTPPFHPQPQHAAYQPFAGNNGRGGDRYAGAPSAAPQVPPRTAPPAAPVPSAPVPAQIANPFAASAPYQSQAPALAQPPAENKANNDPCAPKAPYQDRLDAVVRYAHEVWEGIMCLVNTTNEARAYALIYQTNKHFWGKFGEELPLALFKDRILNYKGMQLMGTARDFHCQACRLGLDDVPDNKKGDTSFRFRELVVHFLKEHVDGRTMKANPFNVNARKPERPIRDWLTQMAPAVAAAPQNARKVVPDTNDNQKLQGANVNKDAGGRATQPGVKIKEEEGTNDQPIASVRKAAAPREEPDLLGALEMHLDGEPVRRPSAVTRDPAPEARAPTRVVYVDEYGREVVPRYDNQRELHRDPRGCPRDADPYGYVVDERDESYQRRLPSPRGYPGGYGPPSRGPSGQYRERSPLPARRYVDERVYSGHLRNYEDEYERGAPPGPPRHYARAPPRQDFYSGYADGADRGGRPYRPVDYEPYEAYEVVRVAGPDGEYLTRRLVRREAPPADRRAQEHYYLREYVDDHRGPGPGYGARYDPLHAAAPEHEQRDVGEERSALPPQQQQRSVVRSDPSYYQEYDPHNPMSGGPMQGQEGSGLGHMQYQ
ncbi:hypothetical protein Sste5346_009433 [Sporothrix stenoceras]|uniref:DUF7892 domain-containing protein n=1 Tax=Sporothrix stenoceras TaxID=5173 RepID=A0ABR3YLH2_9PEZI